MPASDYLFLVIPRGQRYFIRTRRTWVGDHPRMVAEIFKQSGLLVSTHPTTLPRHCEFDAIYSGGYYNIIDILQWRGLDLKNTRAMCR